MDAAKLTSKIYIISQGLRHVRVCKKNVKQRNGIRGLVTAWEAGGCVISKRMMQLVLVESIYTYKAFTNVFQHINSGKKQSVDKMRHC